MNTIVASAIAACARAHMHSTIITYIDHTHLRGLVCKAEVVTAKGSSHTYGGGLHQFTVAMSNDGLAWGHTVVGEANASQHRIQLHRDMWWTDMPQERKVLGRRGKRGIGGQLINRVFLRQVITNGFVALTRHLSSDAAHSHLYIPHTSTS